MSQRNSISTSVRRHFVDEFFYAHTELIKSARNILDIGGKKKNKRGLFNIADLNANVQYVNIDQGTEPDILSDATAIPLPDSSADLIILGEVLEHVPEPLKVLAEAHRLLSPGGTLLATIPFMFPVHADPYDFGRYTDYFWQENAQKLGFNSVVKRHGTIFAVLALAVQHLFQSKGVSWRPIQIPIIKFLMYLDRKTTHKLLTAWTTGYGIVLKK